MSGFVELSTRQTILDKSFCSVFATPIHPRVEWLTSIPYDWSELVETMLETKKFDTKLLSLQNYKICIPFCILPNAPVCCNVLVM